MLLTSSQVSMAMSSGIVFVFTCFLFLAGYSVQQRTVHDLKQTLKPNMPAPPPSTATSTMLVADLGISHAFRKSPSSNRHVAYQQYMRPHAAAKTVDWPRLAHVQLVKDHHSVCNAIMLFGELHRLKSPAKRVLLFPRAWAADKQAERGDTLDPYMDTSRRLLRLAARRYRVELRPVEPVVDGSDEEAASSYSLASVFALQDFDRVMVLAVPGLILDAKPLDSVLAYAPDATAALLESDEVTGVKAMDLLLAMPAASMYEVVVNATLGPPHRETLDQLVLPEALTLDSSADGRSLVASISALHDAGTDFNATAYLSSAAYMRFSDPKLPGPEFDVPYSDRVKARPRNKDADWTWTKLYGNFAQKRMDICGLDLEPWRRY